MLLEAFQRMVSKALLSKLSLAWTIFWGFIQSDFFTFAIPNTTFGLVGALSSQALEHGPESSSPTDSRLHVTNITSTCCATRITSQTLLFTAGLLPRCLAAVVLFNTANLLVFNLANQRTSESAAEDRVNKPGRPVPQGLVTTKQARRILLAAVPCVLAINWALGVWQQGLLIMVHTWLYNDLQGGDIAFIRELIISAAYALFNNGSLKITMRYVAGSSFGEESFSPRALLWTAVISGIILTTMQIQDLKDVEGDRVRGRQTIVLFMGERFSRGSIALFVCFWSLVCARFWRLGTLASAVPLIGAAVIVLRVLFLPGGREDDARTWKIWCFWHTTLYLLPLASLCSV